MDNVEPNEEISVTMDNEEQESGLEISVISDRTRSQSSESHSSTIGNFPGAEDSKECNKIIETDLQGINGTN